MSGSLSVNDSGYDGGCVPIWVEVDVEIELDFVVPEGVLVVEDAPVSLSRSAGADESGDAGVEIEVDFVEEESVPSLGEVIAAARRCT